MKRILHFCFLLLAFNTYGQILLTESFDNTTVPPGWSNTSDVGAGWEFSTNAGYDVASILDHTNNGGNYVWVDFSGSDSNVVLQLPTVDVSTLTTPYFQFYYESHYASALDIFNILYVEAFNGTSWVNVTTLQGNTPFGWNKLGFNVSSFTNGNDLQLRFRAESGGATTDYYNDILIDDVLIRELPTCPEPTNASISNITTTTVDVSWTEAGTATNWDLAAVPQGSGFPAAVGTTATATTFTYSNLMSSTSYDLYLRANCAVNDQSDWVYVGVFETLCANAIAPYAENFNTAAIPNCWSQSGSEAWRFSTAAGYEAGVVLDYNGTSGNYAWIDGSTPSGPSQISSLTTLPIDITQLLDPEVSFVVFSNNTTTNAYNEWSAVITDGNGGLTTIYSSPGPDAPSSAFGPDWRLFKHDVTGLQSPIQVTFTVAESTSGSSFYNDILFDAFKVDEATCPTIATTVSSVASICENDTFNLSATGLSALDFITNNKQDFGVNFVAFSTTPADPYVGGTSLGIVDYTSLTAGNTEATINDLTLDTAGSYEIYAILSPAPTATSCRPSAMTTIIVNALPTVTFATLADLCLDAGIQTSLGGGTTTGGVYSGSGVTDDGNGMTYSFDPVTAGVGVHTITYTLTTSSCSDSASDTVEVFVVDDASFNYALPNYCLTDSNPTPTITGVSGGDFSSTTGLSINLITGEIDIAASLNGTYTVTYTTVGTCVNSSSVTIVIDECAQDNDLCSNATALNLGVTLSGESTAGATDDSTGAADDTDCEPSTFKADVWYTFEAPITGTVNITTVISGNSDQANVAVYSSQNCSQLDVDLIACSTGNGGESVDLTGLTVGQTYYVRVWSDGVAVIRNNQLIEGTFSITITETTLSTTAFDTIGFTYYPNPVERILTLKADDTISEIRVLNILGQVVLRETPNTTTKQLDLSNLQSGAYFIEVSMEGSNRTETVRVIKE